MKDATSMVVAADPVTNADLASAAQGLAARLSLPYISGIDGCEADFALVLTPARLEIRVLRGEPGFVGGHPVAPEFAKLDVTSGPGRSLRQPLLRAVGIKKGEAYRPLVLDGTAGLGEDTWLLAGAGCRVVAMERHPVLVALLRDAVIRAGNFAPEVAERITIIQGDATGAGELRLPLPSEEGGWGEGGASGCGMRSDATKLEPYRQLHPHPGPPPQKGEGAPSAITGVDVIYLDPMYPGHATRKTAERKPMRVLRALVGDDADADALLEPALAAARRRVVVKRPGQAPPLAGRAPTVVHAGRGVRYDVYAQTTPVVDAPTGG